MAINPSSYSVGNRVYRGTSSAPNMGQVDPMGYVERQLNQPSDQRSGLAQAALRRLQGGPGQPVAPSSGVDPNATGINNGEVPPSVPLPDPAAMGDFMGSSPVPIPTVRDGLRARMGPDGTFRVDVRALQEQVATAHDFSAAAQRMLDGMQPIPSAGPAGV